MTLLHLGVLVVVRQYVRTWITPTLASLPINKLRREDVTHTLQYTEILPPTVTHPTSRSS